MRDLYDQARKNPILEAERTQTSNPGRPNNVILARMPEDRFAAIAKSLVPVDLPAGMLLSDPNQPVRHVYFPVSGLVSVDALTNKGESVEVGVIGREGFAGLPGVLGGQQMEHSVIVQGAGAGLRIRASVIREEFSARRPVYGPGASVYLSAAGADVAECAVQSAAPGGREDGAVDVDGERSAGVCAAESDAGVSGADARVAAVDGDGGGGRPAAHEADRLLAGTDQDSGSCGAGAGGL